MIYKKEIGIAYSKTKVNYKNNDYQIGGKNGW